MHAPIKFAPHSSAKRVSKLADTEAQAMRARSAILFLVAAISLAAPAIAGDAKLIYRIDSATAKIEKHYLVISAQGAVKSGGWNSPRLRLKEITLPETTTLQMIFVAIPPARKESVVQALLPVTASKIAHLPHYGAKQITIVAEKNSITVPITR
jgi:hypothetical protein